jgi:3-mercaptopyruvate sulfurtransferase SseA
VKNIFATLLLASLAPFAQAQELPAPWALAVSAEAAAQALARGAVVLDVRPAADFTRGHLPGAVSAPGAGALEDRTALQQLVSSQGIDLSREVVVMGEPGDAQAQRLHTSLLAYATGRVQWFVGGAHEWVLSGRPLATAASVTSSNTVTTRAPVPQHLVALQPEHAAPRMAGAALRDVVHGVSQAGADTTTATASRSAL